MESEIFEIVFDDCYITWDEFAAKIDDKNLLEKIRLSPYLNGITGIFRDGKMYIPVRDFKLAMRDVMGQKIHSEEWD